MKQSYISQLDTQSRIMVEFLENNIKEYIYQFEIKNSEIIYAYHSPKSLEITGYTPEEFNHNPKLWFDIIFNEDKESVKKYFQSLRSVPDQAAIKYRIVNKNKEIKWVSNKATILMDNEGNTIKEIGFLTDITEEKENEEQIEKLLRAVEQSPNSIVITDTQGTIEYINPKFSELTGYSKEETIGQNPRILKSGEQPDLLYKELWDTITSGKEWRGEFHNKKKNGELYWELASISPIRNHEGSITHFLAIKEDITERKKIEDEIIKAKETAERATKSKSEFLANMSHEIRTPMNAIIGMTNLLLETKLTGQQKEFLDTVNISADTLLSIINDILDFSKIEAKKLTLENINFNLIKTVENAINLIKFTALKKKITIELKVSSQFPETVNGDPLRLRQILLNLINNAIKFTHNGSVTINIEIIENSDEKLKVKFSVKDTGIGISEENICKLFKSFSQVDSSMSRKFGGSGLGLAISKELVEMMGGEIWVESKPGVGSTFYFTIVYEKSNTDNSIQKETDIAIGKVQLSNLNILVAEDNEANQKLLNIILKRFGHNVDIAADGVSAVEKARKNNYHIILMDIQMPNMNGYEATKYLRDLGIKIPIIAVSANVFQEDKEESLKSGMNDYITKPYKKDEIISILNKWANKP